MKKKLLLFTLGFFIIYLLSLLSFFPFNNSALAMNSNCVTYGIYGGLNGISISVSPSSVDKNHDITARITVAQPVIDQYIDAEDGVNFYVKGYLGGITNDSVENDNNLLKTTNGKAGGIFVPQNGDSGLVTTFRARADTDPGNYSFYLFADNSDFSRACIINTNTPSITFTEADPDDEPAPECVGEDVECDPTGVGASNLCVCSSDYSCKANDSGENRCQRKIPQACDPNDPEDARSKCLSGVCNDDGTCEDGLIALVCEPQGLNPAGGEYKTGDFTKNTKFTCKTAIGTFNADTQTFTKSILRLLLSISGGILLILIIINGYKLMTSQGDPEKIKDAREGIIAAIAGILLIIFAITILQIITVDIIGIPGFSS